MCSKIVGDPDLENETAAADARVVACSQKISLLPRRSAFFFVPTWFLFFFCSFLLVVNLRGFFFFFLGRKVCMTTRNIKPINSKKAPAFFLLLRLLHLDSLLFSTWIIRRRANRVIARCGLPINFLLVVHHHMWSYHLFIVCTCWCGVTLLIFYFFILGCFVVDRKYALKGEWPSCVGGWKRVFFSVRCINLSACRLRACMA